MYIIARLNVHGADDEHDHCWLVGAAVPIDCFKRYFSVTLTVDRAVVLAHRRMGFQLMSTSSKVFDVAMASAIGLTASPTSLHPTTASCMPCVTTSEDCGNEYYLWPMTSGTQAEIPLVRHRPA